MRSLYVPEVVSRGLVPEDLGSFYKQQLKWARGVYEVAFTEWPRLFTSLTWRQRLSYVTIGTYYLFGLTAFVFLLLPYLYLWGGIEAARMRLWNSSYSTPSRDRDCDLWIRAGMACLVLQNGDSLGAI